MSSSTIGRQSGPKWIAVSLIGISPFNVGLPDYHVLDPGCFALDPGCFALDPGCFDLGRDCCGLDRDCFVLDLGCCDPGRGWNVLHPGRPFRLTFCPLTLFNSPLLIIILRAAIKTLPVSTHISRSPPRG